MKQLEITCPSCNETFTADEALQNHLKAKDAQYASEIKIEKKLSEEKAYLKAELEAKDKIKAAKAETDKVKINLQQLKDDHEDEIEKTLQEREKSIEKKVMKKAHDETDAKIKNAKIDAENAKKETKELRAKFNVDLEKKLKEKDKDNKKSDLENQKLKNELISEKKEKEINKKRWEKKLDEVTKQMKQQSVEVQGEIQEELIEDFLRSKFPDDSVKEIKKGAKGADCILSINDKNKNSLAQIYFESKDHKCFKEEWVNKLLSDMKDKNINYGVLITTSMPKGFNKHQDGYVERHGKRIIVIPMNYQIIHTLVSFIRTNLISEYNSKKSFDAPKALQRLWDHITGPSFQLPLRNLYQTMIKMNDLISKEKNFFDDSIANKERAMLDMEEEFRDMIKSFTLKVGPECLIQIEGDK